MDGGQGLNVLLFRISVEVDDLLPLLLHLNIKLGDQTSFSGCHATHSGRSECLVGFEYRALAAFPPDLRNITRTDLEYPTVRVRTVRMGDGENERRDKLGLQEHCQSCTDSEATNTTTYLQVCEHLRRHDGFRHS